MKRNLILLLLPFIAFCACSESKKSDTSEAGKIKTNKKESILHRLPALYVQDTTTVGSNLYTWVIDRKACDTLAVVTDEMGDRYADNVLKISVKKNGVSLFSRTFRKTDFTHLLDKDFMKYAILDGCRFLDIHEGMVTFSLAVSYPDSDMSRPFKLNIGPDGSYMIVKNDDMEEDYEAEGNDGV